MSTISYLDQNYINSFLDNIHANNFYYIYGSHGSGKSQFIKLVSEKVVNSETINISELETYEKVYQKFSALNIELDNEFNILIEDIDYWLRIGEEENFHRLIREILVRLLEWNQSITIIASGCVRNLPWRLYEVRSRLKIYKVPSIDNKIIQEIGNNINLEYEKIISITFGHPALISWLEKNPNATKEDLSERFFKEFFSSLSEEDRKFILEASNFPIFNVTILQQTLKDYKYYTIANFVEKINLMLAYGLVEWNNKIGGYNHVDNRVRLCINEVFKQKSPDLLIEYNDEVANQFENESKYPTYLRFTLLSTIYHKAQKIGYTSNKNWKTGIDSESIGKNILAWINSKIESWEGASWNDLYQLWLTCGDDEFLVEEFKKLLTEEVFSEIALLFKTNSLK